MLGKIVKLLLEEGVSRVNVSNGEIHFAKYISKSMTEHMQIDEYDLNRAILVALQKKQK